ncbi:MAG: saccharopine dehydrogenase NADP-binding domain-containing protein [Proteobacteria bacterium]|nr:saccharopine dehydrogenase NADP-binding domain-containing protein [Pseudomonadota bacterium]
MVSRVLIIGGYGNFGAYIARRLAEDKSIQVIIGGRSADKARSFANSLTSAKHKATWRQFDYRTGLPETLAEITPEIVIHTSGPFQNQTYDVARQCIAAGCHYIDLSDARDYVAGIGDLNQEASEQGVLVLSGASSVPCLSAAIIDHYLMSFETLESVEYGIATAQHTNRGLATTSAVLSYAGKPFTTLQDDRTKTVYGWQDVHRRTLRDVGRRWFGNCDVPDLELFTKRYPDLKSLNFYAGLEVPVVHLGLWLMSWLTRLHLLPSLEKLAPLLLRISRLFDPFGSDVSAFFMHLTGRSSSGTFISRNFDLVAHAGEGPYIPCAPAIIMARKLARGTCTDKGARPCIGFVDLQTYLSELEDLDITWSQDPIA